MGAEHIVVKRKQLDHKTRDIKWLIEKKLPPITRKQNTHLQNNTQAYMDLWHRTVELRQQIQYSNHAMTPIKNSPNHCQRALVTNQILHTDLQILYVSTVIHKHINKHHIALATHPNPLVEPMLHPEPNRRLKRRWTFDLTD